MTIPVTPGGQGSSTRPYLIRALHDWCTDNGFTPYLAVHVDGSVQVPLEYVKNNEIVLNASFEATSGLQLGNEFISFKARFGGTAREINVPIDHVIAIYARENGQGMAFPAPAQGVDSPVEGMEAVVRGLRLAPSSGPAVEEGSAAAGGEAQSREQDDPPRNEPPPGGARPALKRIK
ncbi:MAG: ClpXP protease specificity-enhancing factor [Methylibium sp.]|uniref:ClpXP protease specificity-enhancing factor n=1 Tax=Methylibium sp. TaxID=2067992 RepID=UPI0017FA76B9|nr:ClpXP protease specificity-enhancing factor [Methylibium sp.]MBA3598874.1 ClpXP protease specificity-enhancing factor [Methylibium sp.]